jgi:3-deoxy-D-manno-octulosonic-acid transferase
MILFDVIYFITLLITLPFWAKYLVKKEYWLILRKRLSPAIPYSRKKRIWIHAVSVGEVKSLKYLMEQLKDKYREKEIVLSVTTPTGYDLAKNQYKSIKVINAPFDFSFTIKKFIKAINPQILILNELEIWPNWIVLAKKKEVHTMLINGRISEAAYKRYRKFVFLLKIFFTRVDCFLLQANIYKERFSHLNIPEEKIIVCGNIKADEASNAVAHLPSDQEIIKFLKVPNIKHDGKKIITLASSHLRDEKLVFPIINQLKENFSFIIVPRHMNRLDEIEKLLLYHKIKYSYWSRISQEFGGANEKNLSNKEQRILVVDCMGYLLNILKITDIVFMGGTLQRRIGGHNLYEPAVLGKLIIGGPFYNNFPDIGSELTAKGLYKIVKSSQELVEVLNSIHTFDFEKIRKESMDSVSRRKGSIQCILKEIQRLIE